MCVCGGVVLGRCQQPAGLSTVILTGQSCLAASTVTDAALNLPAGLESVCSARADGCSDYREVEYTVPKAAAIAAQRAAVQS